MLVEEAPLKEEIWSWYWDDVDNTPEAWITMLKSFHSCFPFYKDFHLSVKVENGRALNVLEAIPKITTKNDD